MPLSGMLDLGGGGHASVPTWAWYAKGADNNHYVINGSTGIHGTISVGQAESLSLVATITEAQWQTDLNGLAPSGYSGTKTDYTCSGSVLPVAGTSKFYVSGYNGATQTVLVRYAISALGVVAAEFAVILTSTVSNFLDFCFCYGANVLGSYAYFVVWTGGTGPTGTDFALLRIPTSGTFSSSTLADYVTQFQTIPLATSGYFNSPTGRRYFSRAAILPDPATGKIGILSYIGHRELTGGVPSTTLTTTGSEYWVVDPAAHGVVSAIHSVQSKFGQPWNDSNTLYSGGVSSDPNDDYGAPIVNTVTGGYEIIFGRGFTDAATTFRFRRYFMNGITGAITYIDTFEWPISGVAVSRSMTFAPREGGDLLLVTTNDEVWYFGQATKAAPSPPAPSPPPTPIVSLNRAWAYNLDGHHFYVLDLGAEGTFAYDTDTDTWAEFETNGSNWSMVAGCMFGDRVVAGDLATTDVWELVPSAVKDSGSNAFEIAHTVTGGLMLRSRVYRSCAAVRLALSWGEYQDTSAATISLSYSDDWGETYSTPLTISLTESDFKSEIVWNSLGSFAAPGRIFKITDVGGPLRIDGADAMLDNFDDDSSQ